jgi:hypothetical protein
MRKENKMSQCKCGCEHKDAEIVDTRDVRIVILQRGWIFVGVFSKTGSECCLDSAMNIRIWGTTKGLGELVNGPLKDTKLDPVPQVLFHEMTIVATLKVNASAWKLK